jgi:hypothetical protein
MAADVNPVQDFQQTAEGEGIEKPCLCCCDGVALGEVVTFGRDLEKDFPGIGENDRRSSVHSPAMGPVYS